MQTVDFETHLLNRGEDGGSEVVKSNGNRNSRGRRVLLKVCKIRGHC
jgi:hypothetical protein